MLRALTFIGLLIVAISILASPSLCIDAQARHAGPQAVQGVLDLREWDFEQDGPVELNGEYEFYWQQHLDPSEFSAASRPVPTAFVKVPGFWKRLDIGERL